MSFAPYTGYHCVSSTKGVLVLLKYVDNSGTVGSLASLAKLLEDDGERYGTVGIESDLFLFGRSMRPQILKRLRDVH